MGIHFFSFPEHLQIDFLSNLPSNDLFKLLKEMPIITRFSLAPNTLFFRIIKILLSRNVTREDIENQIKILAIMLKMPKDANSLEQFKQFSKQIVRNIESDHSTLQYKMQIMVFLSDIYQTSLSEELLDKLFDQLKLTPLIENCFFYEFFAPLLIKQKYNNIYQKKLNEDTETGHNITHLNKLMIGNHELTSEFKKTLSALFQMSLGTLHNYWKYLQKIISKFNNVQKDYFLSALEEECALKFDTFCSLIAPYLLQKQIASIFEKIKDKANDYLKTLEVIAISLTENQLMYLFEKFIDDLSVINLITPVFKIDKIKQCLKQLDERALGVRFILLNTLLPKCSKVGKDKISHEMINLLQKAAETDFYKNKYIGSIIASSHLTDTYLQEYFVLIKNTWEKKGIHLLPPHLKKIISLMAHRFNNEQCAWFRKQMKPLLAGEYENQYRFRNVFYKFTSGITIDEIKIYIPILADVSHEDASVDEIEAFYKFIAEIAPRLQNDTMQPQVFEWFIAAIGEMQVPRTLHLLIYKFIDFIPSFTEQQCMQAADILIKKYDCWSKITIDDENLWYPNELMPFESIDNCLKKRQLNTMLLTECALQRLLYKMTVENRDSFLQGIFKGTNYFCMRIATNVVCGLMIQQKLTTFDFDPRDIHYWNKNYINLIKIMQDITSKLCSVLASLHVEEQPRYSNRRVILAK